MITWSQGTSNAMPTAPCRQLNEPMQFTRTMGIFGSIITNR